MSSPDPVGAWLLDAVGTADAIGRSPDRRRPARLPVATRIAACRSHPRTGVIVRMNAPSMIKENTVSKPLVVVRNWAVEQVTAIVSVCRPIHLEARTR